MNIRSFLWVAAAGLALAACKGDAPAAPDAAAPEPPPSTTAPTPDVTPDPPEAPEPVGLSVVSVKLLEPGAEPRRQLKLTPTADAAGTLDVEVQLDEKMRLAGSRDLPNPSPPRVKLSLTTKVTAVEGETARYDVEVAEAQALALDAAPEPAQRLMPPVLASVRGSRLSTEVSTAGRVSDAPLPRLTAGGPQVQSLASSYLQALQHLPTPLPAEPVGVGARWEVVQRVVAGRLRVQQTLTYEVTSLEATEVKVAVSGVLAMDPDGAAGPGLPKGAEVKSFEGTVTGQKTLDLRRVLPASVVLQLHGVAELGLAARGNAQPGELQVVMDALIKAGAGIDAPDLPKPPPPPPREDDDGHDHGHDHGHE